MIPSDADILKLLKKIQWKSIDKDNMEFQATIPYNIHDELNELIKYFEREKQIREFWRDYI